MRSESFFQRFKYDIALLTIVVLVAIAIILHHYPMTFETQDDETTAAMPPQIGISDNLLILPAKSETAQTFDELDFSFAWYNLMAQELGTFNIELTSQIEQNHLIQSNLIVIPAKSAEQFTESQLQAVQQRVQAGATLIIEMPTPAWEALTGVKRKFNPTATIKRFTDAPNAPLSNELKEHLLNTPLDTKILRIEALDSGTLGKNDLLLELDGAIAHYHRTFGNGHVFVLAFDLGRAITAMQQGKPNEQLEILTENDYPTPSDIILSEKLKNATTPYADLLKKHVIRATLRYSPKPILWPFPNAFAGAVLSTHNENAFGDKARFLADYEKNLNITSTFFVTSQGMSKETLRDLKKQGFDLALQAQVSPQNAAYAKRGPSFFKPVKNALKIAQQRKMLESLAKSPITACKVQNAIWDAHYTKTFRKLTRAKCQIDTTYAPQDPNTYGFLFGTAFPYLPIDLQGLPLPIYEFPTILTDAVKIDQIPKDVALNLLKSSNQALNIPIVVNIDADSLVSHPSYNSLDIWIELLENAPKENHWITNITNFMHFYSLRRQAHLTSNYNPTLRTLEAHINLPDSPYSYTIALPHFSLGDEITSIQVDAEVIDKNFTLTKDGFYNLVKVLPGEHKMRIQWGIP